MEIIQKPVTVTVTESPSFSFTPRHNLLRHTESNDDVGPFSKRSTVSLQNIIDYRFVDRPATCPILKLSILPVTNISSCLSRVLVPVGDSL